MMGVVGQARKTIQNIRDKIISDILRRQKPELDRKIDEMLKPPKVNRIMVRYLGIGKSFGKKITGSRVGRTIGKALKGLGKLL